MSYIPLFFPSFFVLLCFLCQSPSLFYIFLLSVPPSLHSFFCPSSSSFLSLYLYSSVVPLFIFPYLSLSLISIYLPLSLPLPLLRSAASHIPQFKLSDTASSLLLITQVKRDQVKGQCVFEEEESTQHMEVIPELASLKSAQL